MGLFGTDLHTSGKQWVPSNHRHRMAKWKEWEGRIHKQDIAKGATLALIRFFVEPAVGIEPTTC